MKLIAPSIMLAFLGVGFADVVNPLQTARACGLDFRDNPIPKVFIVLKDGKTYSRTFSKDIQTEISAANAIYAGCLTAQSTDQLIEIISTTTTSYDIKSIQVSLP